MERDCANCVYKRPDGSCASWGCFFIDYRFAAEAYKIRLREAENDGERVPE